MKGTFKNLSLHTWYKMNFSIKSASCSFTWDEILEEWSAPDEICDVIMHVLGLVAFLLNCMAAAAYRHMTFPQARFLKNLACADALLPVVFIFQRWLPPFVLIDRCHVTYGCVYMLDSVITLYVAAMSLLGLAGLVANHVIAIVYPLRYHCLMTERKTLAMVLSLWLFPLTCALFTVIYAIILHYQTDSGEPFCETLSSYDVTAVGKMTWIVMSVLVLLLVIGMYIKVYTVAKKSAMWVGRVGGGTHGGREMKRNVKALKTTVFLLVSLLLSWCLIVACMLAISHGLDEDMYPLALGLFHIWLIVNSISDPVILALRMQQVKVAYRQLCRCVLAPTAHHQKSTSLTTSSLRETEMVEMHHGSTSAVSVTKT